MMAGRPTKLTPEMQSRLLALIRAGNYMETAAAACGIAKETLYRWLREGARLRSDLTFKVRSKKARQEAEMLIALSEGVDRALAEAEARDLIVIDKAAQGYDEEVVKEKYEGGVLVEKEVKRCRKFDWGASAWRLERRYPDRWGRKERHEISGPSEGPIPIAVLPLVEQASPEQLEAIAAIVKEIRTRPKELEEGTGDDSGSGGETTLEP